MNTVKLMIDNGEGFCAFYMTRKQAAATIRDARRDGRKVYAFGEYVEIEA